MPIINPDLLPAASSVASPHAAVFEAATVLLGFLEAPLQTQTTSSGGGERDNTSGPPLPLKRTREALWPTSPMVS